MRLAQRIRGLPPYLFAEIDRRIEEKRRQGVDIISFGVGDPDLPSPPHVVQALCEAASRPEHHRYPSYRGMPRFRAAAASWFAGRFGVSLDPEREVLALIGSKEGISHLPLAFLDPGDLALVPDPAYPVYGSATLFCGATPYRMPLEAERGFLPDLSAIPREAWRKARLLFVNYPNNPTTGVADLAFFEELVHHARRHEVIIAHDLAYSEIVFDGYVAPSILQVPGGRETAVEFHSLSKTYNMTGWRVGFAVGGAELIAAFARVKENVDSGVFNAVQLAAVAALEGPQECIAFSRDTYLRRRDALIEGLRSIGWEADPPRATPYVWMRTPPGHDARSFAAALLAEAGVVVAPGSSSGPAGEGYARVSRTLPDELLAEGIARLKAAFS